MKQLAQGETFHGVFALYEDDGVTPAVLIDGMYVMVLFTAFGVSCFKATSLENGGITSIGGGQYHFIVKPSATAKMRGRIHIEVKIFDPNGMEVVIGQPEDVRRPLMINVVPNKIHTER